VTGETIRERARSVEGGRLLGWESLENIKMTADKQTADTRQQTADSRQ
jgi:hypothetical protein